MSEGEEELRSLFFAECEDNLQELQTRLDALQAGERDPETVNAAFRAVHSIKGGSAALGLGELLSFTHEFETVMDRVRSGDAELDPDACLMLLRANDVMSELVEAAQAGSAVPHGRVQQSLAQLERWLESSGYSSSRTDEPSEQPFSVSPDEPEPARVFVRIAPEANFLISGFDPCRLIRELRRLGRVSPSAEGQIPPIQRYTPCECPLAWNLQLDLEGSLDQLDRILSVYAYRAAISVEDAHGIRIPLPELAASSADREDYHAQEPPRENGLLIVRDGSRSCTGADSPPPNAPEAAHSVLQQEVQPLKPAAHHQSHAPVAAGDDAGTASRTETVPARTLRVELERVDKLINLVGEVIMAQAAVAQQLEEGRAPPNTNFQTSIESLTRLTRELQESVLAIRAQPVRAVFSRLPKIVRDLGEALGKEARLIVRGDDVEVDTTVIEELSEPLVHMIRNSMDHGIEPPEFRVAHGKSRHGTLVLEAEQRGGRIRITLSDNGRGIDRERVADRARAMGLLSETDTPASATIDSFIFEPGFSTSQAVSSVSGRGVGMDVVRRKIQALGGRCVVASTPGEGTRFTLTLPITLAVLDGMVIRIEGESFIVPVPSILEAVRAPRSLIETLPDRTSVLRLRGDFIPVYSLRETLRLGGGDPPDPTALIIDTETNGPVAVIVDELIGQRQVVSKSLEHNVGAVSGVSGATVFGDGRVVLILDIPTLLQFSPVTSARMEDAL